MEARLLLALTVGLGGLVALAGQARGDTSNSPLEIQPAAVTVAWEKLIAASSAKPVLLMNELLNDSGRERTVVFGVSSLTNADGHRLCPACIQAAVSNPLAPGGHRQLKMWVGQPTPAIPNPPKPPPQGEKNGKEPEDPKNGMRDPSPGTYNGTLVAFVDESDIAVRVPLTITVGTVAVAATPLVDSVTTTVHCYVPSFIAAHTSLGHHCSSGTRVWIPLKAGVDPGPKAQNLALASGTVGSMDGDHGSAVVNYKRGESKDVATGKAISVEIVGLTNPGDYDGKVDLVTDPEDKVGTVMIKATVSDAWGWAVLAVAIGTLFALLLLRYSGLARASFNLNLRRWEALDAIGKAKAKVAAAAGKPWAGADIDDAVTDKSNEISTKINELGHLSFSDADAKKVAEIEAALAALTTAASDLDSLAAGMPKLELARDTLSDRVAPLPKTDPVRTGAPPLAAEATKLLAPKKLTVEELNGLVHTKVPDMVKLIGDWRSREADVAQSEASLEAIDRDKLTPERQQILDSAFDGLASAWNRLWEAESADEFTTGKIDEDLTAVHHSLADLHTVPHTPHFAPLLRYARVGPMALLPDWVGTATADLLRPDFALGQAGATAPTVTPAPQAPPTEEMIKHLRSEGRRRELILLALGFVIALFTALKALYIGKAWGTWFDYAEAVLWALTASAALTLILVPTLNQLAKLRPLGKVTQR